MCFITGTPTRSQAELGYLKSCHIDTHDLIMLWTSQEPRISGPLWFAAWCVNLSRSGDTQQTQNICITFVQRRSNVGDVGPTLCKCYANVLYVLGMFVLTMWKSYYLRLVSRKLDLLAVCASWYSVPQIGSTCSSPKPQSNANLRPSQSKNI